MHGRETLQIKIALQEIQQIADGEVVDREVKVGDALGRQQTVGENATRRAAAQLEVLHGDPARPRLNCRRVG